MLILGSKNGKMAVKIYSVKIISFLIVKLNYAKNYY